MNKTLLTTGLAFAAIGITTLTFAGIRNELPNKADFSAIKTAIEANNYASLSDTVKAKITEAQFAQAVKKMQQKNAVETALQSGDYQAFRTAKIAEIPTEDEFKKMVAVHAAHTNAHTAITGAIKNNDFTAFKKAHTDLQASLVTLKSDKPGFEPKTLDDTQLKKRFDALVAKYKADGTLPDAEGKGGMMGMMKGGMGGDHMGKGRRDKEVQE